jgi:protein-S-isoprenylcysteine O-methyltransferase Ste14
VNRIGAAIFDRRGSIPVLLVVTAAILGGARRETWPAGALLVALHIGVRLWAGRHLGGAARVHSRKAQERKELVTSGPFGHVRNPLYLANSVGIAGGCLLFGPPWFAAVAVVLNILWYALVVDWEESVLSQLYADEYRAYCALVPRFVPRLLVPAGLPQVATSDLYPWRRVLRRERGSIMMLVVCVPLALLRAAVL